MQRSHPSAVGSPRPAAGLAQRRPLAGGRWHFSHGPIDIVIGADGEPAALAAAHAAAWARFQPLLGELVAELPLLRQPVAAGDNPLRGAVARRMWQACAPFRPQFITPMAAVAGAVAQELIACYQREGVQRAWVNNGGDVAVHLSPGTHLGVGLLADLGALDAAALRAAAQGRLAPDGRFTLHAHDGVHGLATSGWRGRSFSLGIADSVTVLAAQAAPADAAATVVANAVNLQHPGIERVPAHQVRDDTDLGALPVTVAVPRLPPEAVAQALDPGLDMARKLQAQGLILGAVLVCQGQVRLLQPASGASTPFLEKRAA